MDITSCDTFNDVVVAYTIDPDAAPWKLQGGVATVIARTFAGLALLAILPIAAAKAKHRRRLTSILKLVYFSELASADMAASAGISSKTGLAEMRAPFLWVQSRKHRLSRCLRLILRNKFCFRSILFYSVTAKGRIDSLSGTSLNFSSSCL